ncbi:MAG: 2Fe-2S iron-sulfur cluster-binding protein [Syntrophobacterales bacterium]|jgi:bidirectional [NiFe] hydrogenase diaphorase subunit
MSKLAKKKASTPVKKKKRAPIKQKAGVINFTIDGHPVQAGEGWTILDTARHYGFFIPTLCYHEALQPMGACRLCMVEARQNGSERLVASCFSHPQEGMEILLNSERVQNGRRWIMEMLLAAVPNSPEIKKMAREFGVVSTRFTAEDPMEECLRCGLCIRVCEEIVGAKAISFGSRGVTKHVATPYMVPNDACVSCGSCVAVCPTLAAQTRLDKFRGDIAQRTGHGYAHY